MDRLELRAISPRLSAIMHVMRAVAAVLVLTEHSKNRVFGAAEKFDGLGFVGYFLRILFNLGHEAVIVFFILSGFLVGRKMFQVSESSQIKKYFIDRCSRIYIVGIPAIILSWLMAIVLMNSIGISFSTPENLTCSPSFSDAVANLLLLNKIFVDTVCSNNAFWSVQNEMSYYIVFAL
ncbi:MAG: acyltransferase family protein, partial [Sphingobium sp.]